MVALDFPQTQVVSYKQTSRVKVLFLSIYFPLFMGKYFDKAFRRNPDIDFISCGPFTGDWIPWLGGIRLPVKYANPPDICLPFAPNVGTVSYDFVKAQLPTGWTPDLVISCDAGINWTSKPQDGYVATIGTDPHALDYTHARRISDKFFNMQLCYSQPHDVYLPYAYDPMVHYPEDETVSLFSVREHKDPLPMGGVFPKDTDAVLIGMPYENRIQWVNELRKHGVSVLFENAPVFDEYRELANRARIGLNWSSLNDLNARAFETPAFGLCPVMNRVPDLGLFFEEDKDYLGFDSLPEAVEKVLWAKNNPKEIEKISKHAHQTVLPHSYDNRVNTILKECGFI